MKLGATDFVRKTYDPGYPAQYGCRSPGQNRLSPRLWARPAQAARPQRSYRDRDQGMVFTLCAQAQKSARQPNTPAYIIFWCDPKGQEQDVVVQVDASAVAMVERYHVGPCL